jgi:hypothetical protein
LAALYRLATQFLSVKIEQFKGTQLGSTITRLRISTSQKTAGDHAGDAAHMDPAVIADAVDELKRA